MQKIVAIGLRVSAPQIRDFDALQGWLVFNAFWGFLQLATAYTRKRIFTKNTSKDVVPAKDVPLWGVDDDN